MAPSAAYETHTSGSTLVITLPESATFDSPEIPARQEELTEIIESSDASRIVLDLSTIDYMCSTGLGMLVALHRLTVARSQTIELCSPQPQIQDVLAIAMFHKLFRIHESIDAALSAS